MGNPKFDQAEYEALLDEIIDLATARTFDEGYGPQDNGNNNSHLDEHGDVSNAEATRAELAELRDSFTWIKPAFLERPPPDPANFALPIKYLNKVPETLGSNSWKDRGAIDPNGATAKYAGEPISSAAMDTVGHIETLADWDGNAAVAFRDKVTQPLPYVMSNNTELARCLMSAYVRAREIYQTAHDELMGIARGTRDALAQTSQNEDNSSGLTMASALLTMGAGVATFWTGAGATIAVASFTTLAGATAEGSRQSSEGADKKPLRFAGDCVEAVMENMKDALVKYDENHQSVENRLGEYMLRYLSGNKDGQSASNDQPDSGVVVNSKPGGGLVIEAPAELTNEPPPGEDRGDSFAPNTISPWL